MILIIPANAHINIELFVNTGPVRVVTFGFVGSQTPAGTGMHGPGVRTPNAAAVCAAVTGFKRLLQGPNIDTFKYEMQSVIDAKGRKLPLISLGIIFITAGINPIGQLRIAPEQQQNPIYASLVDITFPFSS